jgi:antirestriction protein
MLDIRDLAAQWEAEAEDGHDVTRFKDLCQELGLGKDADWRDLDRFGNDYDPVMIPKHEFVDYAYDLAEDAGLIPESTQWPHYCIDWEYAAKELAHDYSLIEFDGDEYYIRSW